jgi:phosphoglycolate phosphatase-like HAD superfamily hydrolase
MAKPAAIVFDVDGTLVDSVDLHAAAWQRAFQHFGHPVSFKQARSQIGKGGDQLLPVFLSEEDQRDHGDALEEWRSDLFKSNYLPMIRPFSAVPALLGTLRRQGTRIGVASSAKKAELETYLRIAEVSDLVDETVSAEDAERSKPAPDIFASALDRLGLPGEQVIAVGDSPYDAEAAAKLGIRTVGVLSGGFAEDALLAAGCIAVYPGIAALLSCYERSPLAGYSSD